MLISSFAELEASVFHIAGSCLTDVRLQWIYKMIVQVRVIAADTGQIEGKRKLKAS